MIPKVIHYCWFGRNPLPESAIKCIDSWKRFFPDYDIKEWNEDNFDVDIIPYTQEAYKARKYAFVSDYARFWILYNYGGLYFDTDVEIIKPMTEILANGAFMGAEINGNAQKGLVPIVNPGLCIGANPKMDLFAKVLESYKSLNFYDDNGNFNKYTMIPLVTDILKKSGLKATSDIQEAAGLTIYPSEFFNPLDSATRRLHKTDKTCSIHWYTASWQTKHIIWTNRVKQYLRRIKYLFK